MEALAARVAQLEQQNAELVNELRAAAATLDAIRGDLSGVAQRTGTLENAFTLSGGSGPQRPELVDKRLLSKPSIFNGAQDRWSDWSFVLRAYIGAIDPTLRVDMDRAAVAADAVRHESLSADMASRSASLYYVLVLLSMDKALRKVRSSPEGNGLEC